MAESILKRIAAGDPTAVDECLRHYRGLVWSHARRFSTNHADLEDAVQEVFIELWRSADRFDEHAGSESTFVTMIARRRLIDRIRRDRRGIRLAGLTEGSSPAEADEKNQLELADDAAQAGRALEQLRTEERRVLELSIYQGLSQSKIAEATQMPLGTVKTHARRGLVRLRELLSSDSADQGGKGGAT